MAAETESFVVAVEATAEVTRSAWLADVDVGPPGYPVRVQWAPVPGATAVVVDHASVTVAGAWREETPGELSVSGSGDQRTITLPAGARLRAATLPDLKRDGQDAVLRSEADLGRTHALVVGLPDGGLLHTIPPVPRRGAVPGMLGGATFAGSVLNLPDVAGPQVRVQLAEHPEGERFPEKMTFQRFSVGTVTGRSVRAPHDLAFNGPDGLPAWAWPGELLPSMPSTDVDFTVPLQSALETAFRSGQPLDVTFHLVASGPAKARVGARSISGAVLREVDGVQRSAVAGAPVPLAVGDVALGDEQPTSAAASIAVTYDGLRLLETINDAVPSAAGNIGGAVVGDAPVVRSLPPRALTGSPPVAKIGVVGRGAVDSELSVELVDLTGGPPGTPVGPPGTAAVAAAPAMTTVWADVVVPDGPAASGAPLGVAVRATRGRFLWAAGPSAGEPSMPLTRIVVRDPDPGGRPVRLGGSILTTMDEPDVPLVAVTLPPAAFRSTAPALTSDLFVTVEIADLVLRYSR